MNTGKTAWGATIQTVVSVDQDIAFHAYLLYTFVKIIHFIYQYDSPHSLFISSNILTINAYLHHLFMKVVCSKIHVNFIITSAIFQKYTPTQQGNPVTKTSSSHVKTQLSMACSQSVMLELLSGTVLPRM